MEFGTVPLDRAVGGILAHSLRTAQGRIKKGSVLTPAQIRELAAAGVTEVSVARLAHTDVEEDKAAQSLAVAAQGFGLSCDPPFTGRCNLRAEHAGVLRVNTDAVNDANGVDEALTLATPPDYTTLEAGQLAATAKVIPYAAQDRSVRRVTDVLQGALTLHPFRPLTVHLILTRTAGQKEPVIAKGAAAVEVRLSALGSALPAAVTVAHEQDALTCALQQSGTADLTLILGGSATSDRRDIAPAAVMAAGGEIERFGMPVDPGNLLVLGRFRGAPLVILPGCVRSPALNGADWVLQRLAARLPVTAGDIAAMGVGGLLKEIPTRPQPRER